ncbi:MAG: hypothetical protein QNJ47_19265 [Nostocaceae cyanobacterium]|nr:hypothetical protein [Nostocaceae cyanobacterium]
MILKLTCPVCDRPNIEGNICPNCETDLLSLRMLGELPSYHPRISFWLMVAIAVVFLFLGISLGIVLDVFWLKQPHPAIMAL